MKARIIIALLILMIMFGYNIVTAENYDKAEKSNTAILRATLETLNIENQEMDVNKNIGNGDLRFICVCGFACYTPGVEQNALALKKQYGTKCLEGTGDVIESHEHGALIAIATKYAKQYNMILLKKLKLKKSP